MYGLPESFDGSMFAGRTVEIVSFTGNTVFIGFDNEVSITIESSFQHCFDANSERMQAQRVPVRDSGLMQLLGRSVEAWQAGAEGTLTLHFNGGHVLRCFDDSPNFESYRITNGKSEIFV